MASKKSTARNGGGRAVVITTLIAGLVVVGLGAYLKLSPHAARIDPSMRRQEESSSPSGPQIDISAHPDTQTSQRSDLLIPIPDGTTVQMTTALPQTPEGMDQKVFLLTQALQAFGIKDGRALAVHVDRNNAIVDVNDAVRDHGYGSLAEGEIIKVFQMSLGQFPDIETFQLRDGGEIIDSLGHLELSAPIQVIRPGQKPSAAREDSKPSEDSPQLGPN